MAGTQSQMGFGAGATPRKVTIYTSGTGTFTPDPSSTWRRERLYGGGGGGGGGNTGSTGAAGQVGGVSEMWVKNDGVAKAYAVGALGTAGTSTNAGGNGGATTLGSSSAPGGLGGAAGPASGALSAPRRGGQAPFQNYGRAGDGGPSTGPGTEGTGGAIVIEEY